LTACFLSNRRSHLRDSDGSLIVCSLWLQQCTKAVADLCLSIDIEKRLRRASSCQLVMRLTHPQFYGPDERPWPFGTEFVSELEKHAAHDGDCHQVVDAPHRALRRTPSIELDMRATSWLRVDVRLEEWHAAIALSRVKRLQGQVSQVDSVLSLVL
jgi:hypothetical protein